MKTTSINKNSWFFFIIIIYLVSLFSTQSSHSTVAINRIFSEDTTTDSLKQVLIDSLEEKLYKNYSQLFDCEQIEDEFINIQNELVENKNRIKSDSILFAAKIRAVLKDTAYVSVDSIRWVTLASFYAQLSDPKSKKDSLHSRQKDSMIGSAIGLLVKKNQTKNDSMNLVKLLESFRSDYKERNLAITDFNKRQSDFLNTQIKKANCKTIVQNTIADNNEQIAQKLSGMINKDSGLVFEKVYKKKKYLVFKYNVEERQDSFDLSVIGNRTKSPQTIKAAWDKEVAKKSNQPIFIMNAGMFKEDYSAQGLLIEKTKENFPINPLDTNTVNKSKTGNFYLYPNGVFYIKNDGRCYLSTTQTFIKEENQKKPNEASKIKYATQSGPMLVVNKKIHKAFNPSSKNLNLRNGIGIRNVGKIQEVYMVISQDQVTFHEMASFYKDILQCENALYLDGVVSRMYVQLGKKQWGKLDNSMGLGPLLMVTKKKPTPVSANKK